MTRFTGPFIRYQCAHCGTDIEMAVSERRCREQLEGLRDAPALYCAACCGNQHSDAGTFSNPAS